MKLYAFTECTGAWCDDRLTVRMEYGDRKAEASEVLMDTLRESDEKWPDGSRRTVEVDDLPERLISVFSLLVTRLDKQLRDK